MGSKFFGNKNDNRETNGKRLFKGRKSKSKSKVSSNSNAKSKVAILYSILKNACTVTLIDFILKDHVSAIAAVLLLKVILIKSLFQKFNLS